MTRIDINGETAYISYSLQGWIKYMATAMILVFITVAINFNENVFLVIMYILLILIFGSMLTYKVETIFNKTNKKIFHRLSLFGLCKKNSFLFSDLHILAELHTTQYVSYPILWLVSNNNKKYKLGEFFNQDIDICANKLYEFCGLKYEKNF